jgi:hypothetical protein
MIRLVALSLLAVLATAGAFSPRAHAQDGFVPYLGQTPPGATPELFAPGIVNTGQYTRDFTLSPDGKELYFVVIVGQYELSYIVGCRFENGRWTGPEVVPGLDKPGIHYIEPHISPDGRRFFFASNMPGPGKEFAERDEDIWVMERSGTGWGEPRNLGAPINTPGGEFFPTTTRDGTLYYTGPEENGTGEGIYRSRFVDGHYAEPERLPAQVNAGKARYNAFFSPDDRLAVIPIYGHASHPEGVDYYVVFHNPDDTWSEPVSLGPLVNTKENDEHSASLSPDGKYLFFMSPRMPPAESIPAHISYGYLRSLQTQPQNGNPAIWWVEAAFLEKLRPAAGGR